MNPASRRFIAAQQRPGSKDEAADAAQAFAAARQERRILRRVWLTLAVMYAAIGLTAWATDFVTLQDRATVYTVDCRDGVWAGHRCTGALVPAWRYRYEASKARGQVRSWIVSAPGLSAQFSDCRIRDGRNWSCDRRTPLASEPVTLRLVEGQTRTEPADPPKAQHTVQKVRWLFLRWGLPAGREDAGQSLDVFER